MNAIQYRKKQEHEKKKEEWLKENAKNRYRISIAKILVKETGECDSLVIRCILEPTETDDENTKIILKCKIKTVQHYFQLYYKRISKKYKLEQLTAEEYKIYDGVFIINEELAR